MLRGARLAGVVLWPAFLAAGVLEIAVFAFVDPAAVHAPDGGPLALSGNALYSLSFLVFWAVAAVAIYVALRLACSAGEINAEGPGAGGSAGG